MALPDDLSRLADLHQRGMLTDEEFARAKRRTLEGMPPAPSTGTAMVNGLQRSRHDRWLGGVCGGLARSTGITSWFWRLMLVLLVLFGGTGLFLYALMWVLVPIEPPVPATHGLPAS
jgi:phage shock protein PspC (stress-responsive transcriptional regulator)